MLRKKEQNTVKAILFDLGKVLIRFDFDPAFRRLAGHCKYSPKEIEAFFIKSGLEVLYDGGRISSRQFYRRKNIVPGVSKGRKCHAEPESIFDGPVELP